MLIGVREGKTQQPWLMLCCRCLLVEARALEESLSIVLELTRKVIHSAVERVPDTYHAYWICNNSNLPVVKRHVQGEAEGF